MTIGFAFLKNNGAQRMRNYTPQPFLLDDGVLDVEADEEVDLWYERKRERWNAINTLDSSPPADWPWRPLRFIDGKDSGRTVAWLQARTGHPLPVRLAEIGAAAMSDLTFPHKFRSNREKKRSIERMSSRTTLKRLLSTFFSEIVKRRREYKKKNHLLREKVDTEMIFVFKGNARKEVIE